MKLSRFVNNLDNTPLHSSGLAGEGAPAPQSFTERQQVEQNRNLIQGYQKSLTGIARVERGSVRPAPRPDCSPTVSPPATRQQFNATGGRGFTEPSGREYNPYS